MEKAGKMGRIFNFLKEEVGETFHLGIILFSI